MKRTSQCRRVSPLFDEQENAVRTNLAHRRGCAQQSIDRLAVARVLRGEIVRRATCWRRRRHTYGNAAPRLKR
jgi:hypothetical protein